MEVSPDFRVPQPNEFIAENWDIYPLEEKVSSDIHIFVPVHIRDTVKTWVFLSSLTLFRNQKIRTLFTNQPDLEFGFYKMTDLLMLPLKLF